MRARALVAGVVAFCGPLFGQGSFGTTPKSQASEYPVHARVGKFSLGAEYLVHSFSCRNQTFVTSDYLVVEVAGYPAPGEPVEVASGQFVLRLNGKKPLLHAQAPGFVAASLKYPDWERRRSLEVSGGIGDAGVRIGGPARVERFPGDPRPQQTRLPTPPQAPAPQDPSGLDREPPLRAEEAVVEAALPEGKARGPVSGYLYFAYKGKIKSIRKLELIYSGAAGSVTLGLVL